MLRALDLCDDLVEKVPNDLVMIKKVSCNFSKALLAGICLLFEISYFFTFDKKHKNTCIRYKNSDRKV